MEVGKWMNMMWTDTLSDSFLTVGIWVGNKVASRPRFFLSGLVPTPQIDRMPKTSRFNPYGGNIVSMVCVVLGMLGY